MMVRAPEQERKFKEQRQRRKEMQTWPTDGLAKGWMWMETRCHNDKYHCQKMPPKIRLLVLREG